MRSSYALNNYHELLGALTRLHKPSRILEVGILDGFSMSSFADAAPEAEIFAYDLFEEFPYNRADWDTIQRRFGSNPKIHIERGDFYKLQEKLAGSRFDFCHIDVGNEGTAYLHAFEHYLPMVETGGLLLLEGGTSERDAGWIATYNKPPIKPILEASGLNYFTFKPFPGLTVVYKEPE